MVREGGIPRCILNESEGDSAARAHVSYISITEMRDSRSAPTRCILFIITHFISVSLCIKFIFLYEFIFLLIDFSLLDIFFRSFSVY